MDVKKKTKAGNGSTAVVNRPASWQSAIRSTLSKVPEIDAVFFLKADTSVVHVFSIVREFHSKLYEKLLDKEDALEKKFPDITFEFHVRAHQGRALAEAVPFEAELVQMR